VATETNAASAELSSEKNSTGAMIAAKVPYAAKS
jgi:hypothetical protein